jgi:hypothetical protein
MGKKIFLGGLLGGVVVFLMSAVFHMATQLGEVGIHGMPNEDAMREILRGSIHEPGIYTIPWVDVSSGKSKEKQEADMAAYAAKYKEGPTAMLIYTPGGVEYSFGKALLNQFLFSLVGAFLIAWVLGTTASATTYGTRVMIVVAAALFGGFVYTLPYWNWYNFPVNYILAEMGTWVVSWLVAGLAMAAVIKKTASA